MLAIKNFATCFIASAVTVAATSIDVDDASRLPTLQQGDYFYLTLQSFTSRGYVEIVRVTGVSGNTLTVVRGQESTSAKAFSVGDYAEQRFTKATFADFVAQSVAGKADLTGALFTGDVQVATQGQSSSSVVRYDTLAVALGSRVLQSDFDNFAAAVNTEFDGVALSINSLGQNKADLSALNSGLALKVDKSAVEDTGNLIMRQGGPRDIQIAQALANTTGGAYVSVDAPPSPFLGMRWFCMLDGRTYIWIIDSNSSQWVEENPQSPDWITTSPVLSAIAQGTMGAFSHRNLLINGDFRVDQRNAGPLSLNNTAGFKADRWLTWAGAATISIVRATARSDGKTLLVASNSGSTPVAFNTTQRIEQENIGHLAGETVTFSVELHSNNSFNCELILSAATGGVDNWSAARDVKRATISVTGDSKVRRYSVTATLSADDVRYGLAVYIVASSLVGFLAISEAQLERGPVATPFEHRPYGYELSLCKRCYQTLTLPHGGNAYASGVASCIPVVFPVTMRSTPTISVLSGASSVNLSNFSVDNITASGLRTIASSTASGPWNWIGVLVANAEL